MKVWVRQCAHLRHWLWHKQKQFGLEAKTISACFDNLHQVLKSSFISRCMEHVMQELGWKTSLNQNKAGQVNRERELKAASLHGWTQRKAAKAACTKSEKYSNPQHACFKASHVVWELAQCRRSQPSRAAPFCQLYDAPRILFPTVFLISAAGER